MPAVPVIENEDARNIFLFKHGLGEPPTGPSRGAALLDVIHRIGFVQVDSINTVARAHHMILHARRHSYRPAHLRPLLERDRGLFEHWTHDASVIPTEFFPHWQLRFSRDAVRIRNRWKEWRRDGFEDQFEVVLKQIREHGPVGSSDVGRDEPRGSGGWWDWHPSKTALEYLWRTGQLSVTRRDAFRKIYDLTENVIPTTTLEIQPDEAETIEWACSSALDRLGFATSGEIAAFWEKISPAEAKQWCVDELRAGRIIEADITCHDGTLRRVFLRPDTSANTNIPEPPKSVRILSPFDPALRDRKRTERLFGFHYRIEIFVPEAKRQYGYYVFPVLEGSRLIGRVDMKCDRKNDRMNVTAFWPEDRVTIGKSRLKKLETALDRTARFAGVSGVDFSKGWLRT